MFQGNSLVHFFIFKMQFHLFCVLKFVQITLIVFALWRVFSETEICGHFVSPTKVLRHGIDGSCRQLFFYLDPDRQFVNEIESTHHRPKLRLWWTYEASEFMPPIPDQREVKAILAEIKAEVLLEGGRRMRRMNAEEEEEGEEAVEEVEEDWKILENGDRQMDSLLPDQQEPFLEEMREKRSNGQSKEEMATKEAGSNNKMMHCYELNLQGSVDIEPGTSSQQHYCNSYNPLAILASRSVVTVAVALAHLLLLFAQIYLLNCLDEDNLEQKRGKLFLELFVVLVASLGWLFVFLLKMRTVFDWDESLWSCTNFRPNVLGMVVIIQIISSILLIMGLFESVRLILKMRKLTVLIQKERECEEFKQRSKIRKYSKW